LIEQSRRAEYDRPTALLGYYRTLGNVRHDHTIAFACIDNETRALSLMTALRVNSGTAWLSRLVRLSARLRHTVVGAMIPLSSPLMEKVPKLLGAKFATRNGSIIILRRDSRQADAQLRIRATE
jgi:hypothetical protein